MSEPPSDGSPETTSDAASEDARPIENPPEIMWGDSRSLLLTLRHIQRVFRSDPDLADDLLAVAYLDARQIIEDADEVIGALRGRPSALRRAAAGLAESIEGELEGDDAADEQDAPADDEQGESAADA